jgi:hypothetical protein
MIPELRHYFACARNPKATETLQNFSLFKWEDVQLVVTDTARTSLTQSLDSVVVSQTQKSESLTLAERRLTLMNSHSPSTWFPTNMNRFPLKHWKLPVLQLTSTS